jgi:tetratricopeptide (TPR) repeat protein
VEANVDDQVTLKSYVDEVRLDIHSGRHDDAIELCQHILHYYPKHLDSYRLMAEASLEKGEIENALGLFRRVLSADPENVVAYAGLALIYQQQTLGEEALWHLERAYELAPTNLDLRERLLRLHAEVNHKPKLRLKLTSGGLARLYVQEGLYYQAIQEFRNIATTSPKRFDARVGLVETLWHAGRVREAAETAQALLHSLPYCLKANLLLGTIWAESGLKESDTYLENARLVDPTNQVAHDLLGKRSPLHLVDVLVPRYYPGVQPPPMPSPAEAPTAEPELEPDWLTTELAASESAHVEFPIEPGVETGIEAQAPTLEPSLFTPSEIEQFQAPPATEEGEAGVGVELVQPQQPQQPSQPQSLQPEPEQTLEVPPFTEAEMTEPPVIEQAAGGVDYVKPQPQPLPPAAEEIGVEPELPTAETEPLGGVNYVQPQPQPQPSVKPSIVESDLPPWLSGDLTAPAPPSASPTVPEQVESTDSGLPAWLIELQKNQSGEPGISEPETAAEKQEDLSGLPAWVSDQSNAEEQPTAEQKPEWMQGLASAEETTARSWAADQGESPAETSGLPAWLTGAETEPPSTEGLVEPQKTDLDELEAAFGWELGKTTEFSSAAPTGESTEQDLPEWLKAWQSQPVRPETPGGAEMVTPEELQAGETPGTLPEMGTAGPPSVAEQEPQTSAVVPEIVKPEEVIKVVAPSAEEVVGVEQAQPQPQLQPPQLEPVLEFSEAEAAELIQPAAELTQPAAELTQPAAELIQLEAEPIQVAPESVQPMQEYQAEVEHAQLTSPETIEPVADTTPIPEVSMPPPAVELPGPETLPAPTRLVRRRRPQKGSEYLERARAFRDANQLSDALKEYDQAVQHAPRLITHIIPDLEDIIRQSDAPLDAHRILGDAYTRVDRLADALERYRFVLDRVS